uniref:Uncharacterized protein n=1 Tax=Ananas comosus var. bracteatus TaxID=296719 RepID=A0A6V7PGW3_ANACO|nr:unnamed protein product [Ananas comosus var. bracteatus]
MASSQTICRKYQILMSNNMECVKDYKLPTSREAPIQAQNQVGLRFDPSQSSNRKCKATKGPSKSPIYISRTGQFPPRGTGLSPAGTGLSLRTRKSSVREPVSPCTGPVSHYENALGNRSRLPGTGCLVGYAALFTGGPVSPIRDRSPRVKLSGLSRNSRDRTFRPVCHRRPSTKCGKVRNTSKHSNLAICKGPVCYTRPPFQQLSMRHSCALEMAIESVFTCTTLDLTCSTLDVTCATLDFT